MLVSNKIVKSCKIIHKPDQYQINKNPTKCHTIKLGYVTNIISSILPAFSWILEVCYFDTVCQLKVWIKTCFYGFIFSKSSMLEYSMMDCMFSRYIYPANGS